MEPVKLDEPSFVVLELVENVTTGITNGLVVPIIISPPPQALIAQGGNDDDVLINIDPRLESAELPVGRPAEVPPRSSMQLVRAMWMVSLLTLIMDIATALYKPAKGVVFGRSKLAYYITLGGIFVAGLGEAFTAFCLSRRSHDPNRRRFSFSRVVLCLSVGPFVAIISIGSFAFIQG